MRTRLELHDLLIDVLLPEDIRELRKAGAELTPQQQAMVSEAASRVYFQPPENFKMKFPCIVYRISTPYDGKADNIHYTKMRGYEITHINANPDNEIHELIADFPYCEFLRFFASANMNHYVYNLYF